MENADKPISPIIAEIRNEKQFTEFNIPHSQIHLPGLSKREYFAGLAMQGILASDNSGAWLKPQDVAGKSIQYADELLKQLENK
ncbi:hypothetical protein [Elizabethkingia anophelis]|uniref:hypothetical protein n=1 Tax=Elizabethkingia anophelis TaxID=1117645 RepID=UPI003891E009